MRSNKMPSPRHTISGGDDMAKQTDRPDRTDDLRLNPEQRLCAKFDTVSIANFPVALREEMGVRVLDNCAEEHIM